jgi:Domain of unknown function (DUF4399)
MSLRERRGTMRRRVAVPHFAVQEVPHTMSTFAVSKLPIAFSLALWIVAIVAGPTLAAEPSIPRSPRPEKARVYFITPKAGEQLKSPVVVRFGLEGMGVAPAGVAHADTGHHHLVIDAVLPPPGLPVPKSDHYLHFGGGQTEISLDLAPGKHTLQLLLGDHNHVPHDPPVASGQITIEVVK